MGKTLKTVAIIAAAVAVAVFAPEIAPLFLSATATAATTAATVATITAIGASIALSTASMALFGPKIPKTQMSRLNVSLDPSTPRKAVFGTTAMPLDLRYHESSGTDQEYVDYIVAVAAHKVGSIDEIWFEEKLAWTANGGATATYAGYLTVTTRTEGSAANYISINGGGKWGSSRRLTGCAYVHLRIKRTGNTKKAESPLVNGLPSRVTIIGDGARLYDPRKDSTVPGGSGSHRATDQATWGVYTDADDTDNPVLQLLWWLIGWQINGKLSVGCGVPYNRIDMASFITAANICDENVTLAIGGTQKRYRTSGTASDADDRLDIINNLLASMNGTLRDNGGKLTVTAMKNDLANYVLTFNESDMLGGFDWQQTRGLTENYNIVRGRYVDPSPNSLYQMVDYPEIELAVSDGIERVMSLDLPYVEDGRRAQRIAKQVFQRNQYRGMFSATFNAKALGCQVGNVVRINLEALGWVNKLFRVVSQEIRFDGQVPMALVEENAAIYAWDAEDVAPITPTAPTIYNPLNNPFILGLAAAEAVADGKIDSYYQASAPTGATEGDYWTDTDDANKLYRYTTGVWTLIRDTGIPAAITAAAGAQATADGKVTTFYVETTPTAQALGDLWYKPSTKYLTRWNGTAWADVATVGAKAGTNLLDSTGATLADAAIITSQGTAALIANQAATATSSDFSAVTGTTKPANNATVGAVAGTNLKDSGGTVLSDAAIKNSQQLWAEVSGTGRPADNATVGAAWGSNLTGRPVELTDGRIDTGLDTAGRNKVGINAGSNITVANEALLEGINGTQLHPNPEFQAGSGSGWGVYNNAGGSRVSIAVASESGIPNGTDYRLAVTVDAASVEGSDPTPGWGGVHCSLTDAGVGTHSRPNKYARGTFIYHKIRAKIPVGRTINWASNSTGNEAYTEFLTTQDGTGDWKLYVMRQYIGRTGTFSSTGFFYIAGGASGGFTWYIAKWDQIDLTGSPVMFLGSGGLYDSGGAALVDGNVRNEDLRIVDDASGTGGRGRLTIRRNAGGVDIQTIELNAALQNKDQAWADVGGTGKPENNATVGAVAGTNLKRSSGVVVSDSQVLNESQLWSDVSGTGRPSDNATVGAIAGTNLKDSGGTVLSDGNVRNSDMRVAVDTAGTGGRARARIFRDGGTTLVNEVELPSVVQNKDQAWADVSGTGRPSDNATSDIRLVGTGTGIVITGNRVTRPTGGGDWTAQAYTPDGYIGGAYCSFSFETNAYAMAGLDSSPTDNASYSSIDFCWYCPADSTLLYIYESGANPFTTGGAHNSNTVLSVVYDNEYVRYLKDGVEMRSVYVGAGKKYHFDSSIVQSPGITNIRFGPYAAANAPVTFTNANGQSSNGNSVFKPTGSSGWNSKSTSLEVQKGTAVITWKMTGPDAMVGLHQVGNTNPDYGSLYASIYRSSGGSYVYESGGNGTSLGAVDDNTVYRISYDGTKIEYYINNSLVRTFTGRPAGLSFQAGAAIYHTTNGSVVSNVQFGAYTDNAWSSVDGSGKPENNATVGAVAGTNLVDVSGNQIGVDNIRNNMALIDWWKKGATIPWSQNAEYNVIGSAVVDLALPPPVKGQDDVWFCQEVSNNGDQGGGWNGGTIAKMDPDKTYRFVLPIRNRNGDGTAYWGTDGIAALNTTTYQSNPYFCATGLPTYDRWYLFVGYIYPRNSTSKNSDDAGVWDCKTGTKYVGGTNYCFLPDGTQPTFRAYQYYASNGSQKVFGRPLINLVDGTEPDLRMYFEEGSLLNNQQRFDEIVAGNGKPENNADVTLTAQITTQAPDDVTINADYLGAIIAGQFNKITTPIVTKAGSSVRTNDRATYTATNITGGLTGYVTMNNTTGSADKGRATITNCTSSGSYNHNIFWDGVLIVSYLVKFTVVAADPPLGGGGSGGTGNKSGSFDSTGFTVSSTSFAVVGTITNLTKASGETIRCSFPSAEYQVNATTTVTRSIVAKWQYSATGANSWTDVGSAVTGSASSWDSVDVSGNPGSITVNQNVAPSDAAYDLRLVAAMNTSGNSITFQFGTASVLIGV